MKKVRKYFYLPLSILILVLLLVDCKNNASDKYFLKSSKIVSVSKEDVLKTGKAVLRESYKGSYGVTVYKIDYKTTDVADKPINASGAVIVPDGGKKFPILSYQHGTLTDPNQAPSKYNKKARATAIVTAIAGSGYAVVVPDYLGYGTSANYNHPYQHAATLASASFDMLQAAKEFFKKKNVSVSEKLFLTGYSEGGYATMALHKYIEENSKWKVTMSAPASGAYNTSKSAFEILEENENLQFLPYYIWVLYSYNWIYKIDRKWDKYVNEPYTDALSKVTNPMAYPKTSMSINPTVLFLSSFADGVVEKTDTKFVKALESNDIFDWTPKYPITLYYGTADNFVFPLNSITAQEAISRNGGKIKSVVFEGKTHATTVPLYWVGMYNLFESLK